MTTEPTDQIISAIQAHQHAVVQMLEQNVSQIAQIAELLSQTITAGGKILIAGNGGSAADAQHIAGELIGRFLHDRAPIPAIALSTDTSVLTCVANDYSFDQVFVRQVDALINPNDLFWAISTSGNSPNILLAAESAKNRNATVIAFTGRTGGQLTALTDVLFTAPADRTDRIQELHILAYHIICQLVEQRLLTHKGD